MNRLRMMADMNVKMIMFLLFFLIPLISVTTYANDANDTSDEDKTYGMEDVVVTATRSERTKEEVPAAVTVISKTEIEQTPAMNPLDILDQSAGVIAYSTKGFLSSSTANNTIIRGLGGISSGHVLVLVDGVPANDTQSSLFHWNDLNPADVERIEIVRGPGSALYGSSAMGGVINIITARPKEGVDGWKALTARTTHGKMTRASAANPGNSDITLPENTVRAMVMWQGPKVRGWITTPRKRK